MPEPTLAPSSPHFQRSSGPDGLTLVTCLRCGQPVGSGTAPAVLAMIERDHRCAPERLQWAERARPSPDGDAR